METLDSFKKLKRNLNIIFTAFNKQYNKYLMWHIPGLSFAASPLPPYPYYKIWECVVVVRHRGAGALHGGPSAAAVIGWVVSTALGHLDGCARIGP